MESWETPEPPSVARGEQSHQLRLFDTATQQLHDVVTAPSGKASLYVCGITPYDATHLGHANTYVTFDLLNRFWRAQGHTVTYTQNITDVDDPLFERANDRGLDWEELATDQTNLFRSDMEALNVLAPDHYLAVSETVDWVIDTVTELVEAGIGYTVPGDAAAGIPDGDIYFDITAAEAEGTWTLGQISGMSLEEMQEVFPERGGDPERPGKRNPLDPLLWKAARPNEPFWEAEKLPAGRPGWHIECSAMARRTLPAPFDVQGGGSDLRFPHHEFSAAHAMAVEHTDMAKFYVHSGMVGLDGEKMSKSLGNLVLVSELTAAGHEAAAVRAVLLNHHYRSDWSYTTEELHAAEQRLATWRQALAAQPTAGAQVLFQQIMGALADDLNAPQALQDVDDWAQRVLSGMEEPTDQDDGLSVASVVDAVLGIRL